ncbi:MAG: peptide deformylase [Cyclobacteriaceae bacterium]|nr:peptide deformylase [Cyclobacteriaceae bacterium]
MKGLKDMLLLGNPLLYQVCEPVKETELGHVPEWVADLHNVMEEIRAKYHFGRGIAAPQLGNMRRLIYTNVAAPKVFINPEIIHSSEEMFEVWDDCMCFPHLLVKVMRHKSITLRYRDAAWELREETFTDDLSELMQHEFDHLDGILCTMRAIDDRSFRWRP